MKAVETDSHSAQIPPAQLTCRSGGVPPMSQLEIEVRILPGSSETERIAVVLCPSGEEGSRLELRQQSYSEGIGWFTQSTVRLEPSQVADLRSGLGMASAGSSAATRRALPREYATVKSSNWQPRILAADSA